MSFMYKSIKNPTVLFGKNSEVIAVFTSEAHLDEALEANRLAEEMLIAWSKGVE